MCGILAHAGNVTKKLSLDKLNILGILNEVRGTDSCGLTIDGHILHGVDGLSSYRDFISYYDIVSPKIVPTVIGHTRKSTIGVHSKENAHPFGFGSLQLKGRKRKGFAFVGVHNGTLLNHIKLATDRGISITKTVEVETEDINDKNNVIISTKTVSKIDSELLLECIYKDKSFKVLSQYEGAAALIMCNLDKPNTIYCYHGESVLQKNDKEIKEERPLWYWQQSRNSLYISSIEDSLYAIGGDRKTVHSFDYNVVYEITNGNVATAKLHKISRQKCWQRYGGNSWQRYGVSCNDYSYANDHSNLESEYPRMGFTQGRKKTTTPSEQRSKIGLTSRAFFPKIGTSEQIALNLEVPIDKGLLTETFDKDPNTNKGLTLVKSLRYWRNGHKASGVFAFIMGYGFYYLAHNRTCAIRNLKKGYAGKGFLDGVFKMYAMSNPRFNEVFTPFPTKLVHSNPDLFLYYIHAGIRYKNNLDWKIVIDDASKKNKSFSVVELSMSSSHPIIDLRDSDSRLKGVYYQGRLADGTFSILGSPKLYSFTNGQVKNIKFIEGQEPDVLLEKRKPFYSLENANAFLTKVTKKPVIILPVNTEAVNRDVEAEKLKALDKIIVEIKKEEDSKYDKIVNEIIQEEFNENFEKFPLALRKLRKFKDKSPKAKIAYDILNNFLEGCEDLVYTDIEIKNKKDE